MHTFKIKMKGERWELLTAILMAIITEICQVSQLVDSE